MLRGDVYRCSKRAWKLSLKFLLPLSPSDLTNNSLTWSIPPPRKSFYLTEQFLSFVLNEMTFWSWNILKGLSSSSLIFVYYNGQFHCAADLVMFIVNWKIWKINMDNITLHYYWFLTTFFRLLRQTQHQPLLGKNVESGDVAEVFVHIR